MLYCLMSISKLEWNDWSEESNKWTAARYSIGSLTAIETKDGKRYGSTLPIMRLLSKHLDKYKGSNDVEEHFVDSAADVANDSYNALLYIIHGSIGFAKEHVEKDIPFFCEKFERIYDVYDGPYNLGCKISYADFLVYQMISDEQVETKGLLRASQQGKNDSYITCSGL